MTPVTIRQKYRCGSRRCRPSTCSRPAIRSRHRRRHQHEQGLGAEPDAHRTTCRSRSTRGMSKVTLPIVGGYERRPPRRARRRPDGPVGGTVPATLSLTSARPRSSARSRRASTRTYEASTTANVISTAGDALLSVADPSSTEHRPPGQRLVLPAAAAAGPGAQRRQHRHGVQQRRLLGLAAEPADVRRADLQRRGHAGVQPARQRQRRAPHGRVQQDADVHAEHDSAVGSSGAPGRPASEPARRSLVAVRAQRGCRAQRLGDAALAAVGSRAAARRAAP